VNLREQLRHLLPEFLPNDPGAAVKGTDLIRQLRLRLGDEYSDATLRYHFSILCYDPTSPIAKVDQGQGYYQRQRRANGAATNGSRMGLFTHDTPEMDAARLRFQQVAAVYERLCLMRSRFPFLLNGRDGVPPLPEGDWEVPDFVLGDWETQAGEEEGAVFDESSLQLRRHLGGPEVCLTGVRLKLGTTLESYAADFFQALSATRWAVRSELVIAEPLADEALVDALRALGHQFGVGITSLGIDPARLEDFPLPDELAAMSAAEFENLCGRLHLQKITLATARPALDWAALSSLRKKHEPVNALMRWLAEAIESRRPSRA
jgi:hypothetical protein